LLHSGVGAAGGGLVEPALTASFIVGRDEKAETEVRGVTKRERAFHRCIKMEPQGEASIYRRVFGWVSPDTHRMP
jgi:hypothetical protein